MSRRVLKHIHIIKFYWPVRGKAETPRKNGQKYRFNRYSKKDSSQHLQTIFLYDKRGIPLYTFRPFTFTTAPLPTILRLAMNTQQSRNVSTGNLSAPTNGPPKSVSNTPASGTNTPFTTIPPGGPRCTTVQPATPKKQARGSSFTTPEDEARGVAKRRTYFSRPSTTSSTP